MRRVDRDEAVRLIAAVNARPEDVVVHEVRGFEVREERLPTAVPPWADNDDVYAPSSEIALSYEFDDGSVYVWGWDAPETIREGERLWCTHPRTGGPVRCVRMATILARPDVLTVRAGSLTLRRSARLPEPLVDPAVIAPADTTRGTGVTQEDARFVLDTQPESGIGVKGLLPLLAVMIVGFPIVVPVSGLGSVGGMALGGGLILACLALWTYLARRRRDGHGEEALDVVEVVRLSRAAVEVRTAGGEHYAWPIETDDAPVLTPGSCVWSTPVSAGRSVRLVGRAREEDRLVAVRPSQAARLVTPPARGLPGSS